jgi:hypothetical protein
VNIETQSIAEVYFMAFQSLSEKEKEAVIARLLEDENLREDILDITLIRERQKESGRPFREYLNARVKRSN